MVSLLTSFLEKEGIYGEQATDSTGSSEVHVNSRLSSLKRSLCLSQSYVTFYDQFTPSPPRILSIPIDTGCKTITSLRRLHSDPCCSTKSTLEQIRRVQN